MESINNDKGLRYALLKENGFNVEAAKKCWDFINSPEAEQIVTERENTDGIYIAYTDGRRIPFAKNAEYTDTEEIDGIGVKFGGHALVLNLNDICNDEIELTTQKGGTRFITDYHKAVEDMDGMAATDDIRDILNMDIADSEYIPSLGELYFILAHFTAINEALEAVGGEPLHDDWYWSSTQYSATNAWPLYLYNGTALYFTKATYQLRVRPVSAF